MHCLPDVSAKATGGRVMEAHPPGTRRRVGVAPSAERSLLTVALIVCPLRLHGSLVSHVIANFRAMELTLAQIRR